MYDRCFALALTLLVPIPSSAEDRVTQTATADDMRIMEHYVGEFRSPAAKLDDGKTEYYHIVKYEWFDRPKTIVKFTISMAIPSQKRVITTAEGFYSLDRIENEIQVFGAFNDGTSGSGAICQFDHATGSRTVCARSVNPDGSVTQVRDSFQIVDENTWRNSTRVRQGNDEEWSLVYEGTYARVESQ